MSKYVKGLMKSEFESKLEENEISNFMVVNLMGISGNDNNMLRGELKQKGVHVAVVKNSLFRAALKEKDMADACELFEGACAIAYGGDSIVDVAKELVACKKKVKQLEIKGAFLEGNVLGSEEATEVSKMKSRTELVADVIGIALAPGSNLAGAITGPASYIAGCLKTISEQEEEKAA